MLLSVRFAAKRLQSSSLIVSSYREYRSYVETHTLAFRWEEKNRSYEVRIDCASNVVFRLSYYGCLTPCKMYHNHIRVAHVSFFAIPCSFIATPTIKHDAAVPIAYPKRLTHLKGSAFPKGPVISSPESSLKLRQGALVRYLLNIHLTMRDKLVNRCDLTFKMLVKKLKYINVFFALGTVYQTLKRRGGRRGGRWALACAAHQVKQISCKGSIVFLGGEFLWEGL